MWYNKGPNTFVRRCKINTHFVRVVQYKIRVDHYVRVRNTTIYFLLGSTTVHHNSGRDEDRVEEFKP